MEFVSRDIPLSTGVKSVLQRLAFILLWLLVFAIPWENAVVIPGLGTISRLIGILALIVGVFAVAERKKLRGLSWFHIVMIAYVYWVVIGFFWSPAKWLMPIRIRTMIQLFAMVWLIWELVTEEHELVTILQAYVLGAYVSATSTIYNRLINSATESIRIPRYAPEGFDPNDLGLTLALGIPIAWYLATNIKTRYKVLIPINYLYVAIGFVAIVLTASRGATLSALAALSIVPWSYHRVPLRWKLIFTTVMVITVFWMGALVPDTTWDRLLGVSEEIERGALTRTNIWASGIHLFWGRPFVGLGTGGFESIAGSVMHNTFLAILVDHGIIGFGIFAAMLAALLLYLPRLGSSERIFWLVLLLTWALGTSFLSWQNRKPSWLILGLMAAQAAVGSIRDRQVNLRGSGSMQDASEMNFEPHLTRSN